MAKGKMSPILPTRHILSRLLVGSRKMKAQVELIKGDMFEGPSDLMVIPCSTVPTITWFVAEHLRSFGIPKPRDQMDLGDVAFVDLRRANNIAQVAAMAASVM